MDLKLGEIIIEDVNIIGATAAGLPDNPHVVIYLDRGEIQTMPMGRLEASQLVNRINNELEVDKERAFYITREDGNAK